MGSRPRLSLVVLGSIILKRSCRDIEVLWRLSQCCEKLLIDNYCESSLIITRPAVTLVLSRSFLLTTASCLIFNWLSKCREQSMMVSADHFHSSNTKVWLYIDPSSVTGGEIGEQPMISRRHFLTSFDRWRAASRSLRHYRRGIKTIRIDRYALTSLVVDSRVAFGLVRWGFVDDGVDE